MDTKANTIQNNALAKAAAQVPQQVLSSIAKASANTGVNFAYLMQQASVESNFNPVAKAKTSSASGLYQFIESTWISMVKKHGDKYGMGDLADKIDSRGRVADKQARKEILALRNDPEKASALAAEFASENQDFLESRWKGDVGSTELYMAHFMGAGGAAAFLKARDSNPLQQAAILFPKAAQANRNVFYDTRTGRPRTMDEVYAFFDKKFDIKTDKIPAIAQDAIQVASADPVSAKQEIYSDVFKDPSRKTFARGFGSIGVGHNLVSNPVEILMLSQLDMPMKRASIAVKD